MEWDSLKANWIAVAMVGSSVFGVNLANKLGNMCWIYLVVRADAG